MRNIWYSIYNIIFIPLLVALVKIGSLFNKKIAQGIKDRKKLFENLIISLLDIDRTKKMIWFHSASMGEFEQAKPIIKKLKAEKDVNVIVTFFSPSGYRNSLNYPYADVISYLPLDSSVLTKRFIKYVRPNLVIFMRYDIWPNLIWSLNKKSIPTMIVDATMRSDSNRKLPGIKNFHKSLYQSFTKILTVSEQNTSSFKEFGLPDNKVVTVGDTRYDRVYEKSLIAKDKKLFDEKLIADKKVFVFGSSWEADEDVILPAITKVIQHDPNVIMILAPHEPTTINLDRLENYFSNKLKMIRFSYINYYNNENVILVDSIGILLTLYYYADLAYVGGSFKQGIHNVLEPAVYGIPVIYGPKHQNSLEALKLSELGSGIVVHNKKEAYRQLRTLLADDAMRNKLGNISKNFVEQNIGASQKILKEILEII